MLLYDRSATHDSLVLQWYGTMLIEGEFDLTFTKSLKSPSRFLSHFSSSATLAFEVDDRSIWFAFWYEPLMSGTCIGLWIRGDKRQSKTAYRLLCHALDCTIRAFPVVLAVTRARLVDPLRSLGFAWLGMIPSLWDGQAAYVFVLTPDLWKETAHGRKQVQHAVASERPVELVESACGR